MEQITLVDFERSPTRRLISDVRPLSLQFSLGDRGENFIFLALDVTAISGNVLCTLEQSFDSGTTWEVIPGVTGGAFNTTGIKKVYMTPASGVVSPVCRVVITPAAGQTCQLNNIRRLIGIRNVGINSPVSVSTVAVEALLTTTNAILTDVDTNTDGLEALITATNAKLDTLITQTDGLEVSVGDIDVNTDGLETLVTDTNTKLDTVIGHVDGVETLIGSTNTKLDTLITQTDGVEASLTSIAGKDFATEVTLAAAKAVLDSIDNGLPNALGRQTAAASTGVVLSTEDKTSLDAIGTKLDTLIAQDSFNTRIQTPVLILGSTIQASVGTRILAATLTGDVKRIRVADTTGLFIGVYDALAAGNLLHIINPGMDGYIDQEFANGTTLYFISMTTDAGTSGSYVSLNFLG